jgi:DNA helicase HerA-like ATPase
MDIIPKRESRCAIIGTTGSGKTTLLSTLLNSLRIKYPEDIHLIIDSKPRFRADYKLTGFKIRYKNMQYGDRVKDSVLIEDPEDISIAINRGYKVLIAQIRDEELKPNRLSEIGFEFYKTSTKKQIRWLWVDEALDFFTPSGTEISGSTPFIMRTARAGRERGCNLIFGAQRLKGIPMVVMESVSQLYLFHMDYTPELVRLKDIGLNLNHTPKRFHEFYYWDRKNRENIQLIKLRI